ncbi:hypothetical protein Fot_19362 [Forsythia ovata]|uniref:Uncharacterized protein n=1 Tax=Forsythia ovata TaxID=205694 RepID=A0ABD1VKU0_9LAMI
MAIAENIPQNTNSNTPTIDTSSTVVPPIDENESLEETLDEPPQNNESLESGSSNDQQPISDEIRHKPQDDDGPPTSHTHGAEVEPSLEHSNWLLEDFDFLPNVDLYKCVHIFGHYV